MLFYTIGQSQIFLAMLYAGIAVGLWLDFMSQLQRLFQAGRLLALCLDIAWGVGAAAIIALALVKSSYGDLRPYALLGVICGFVLYQASAGPLLRWLTRGIGRGLGFLAKRAMSLAIMKKILK